MTSYYGSPLVQIPPDFIFCKDLGRIFGLKPYFVLLAGVNSKKAVEKLIKKFRNISDFFFCKISWYTIEIKISFLWRLMLIFDEEYVCLDDVYLKLCYVREFGINSKTVKWVFNIYEFLVGFKLLISSGPLAEFCDKLFCRIFWYNLV